MSALWWSLPGPRRFASEVAGDLRDGSSVVVLAPEHLPDGLDRAVRRELGDNAFWTSLDLADREVADREGWRGDDWGDRVDWDAEDGGHHRETLPSLSTYPVSPAVSRRVHDDPLAALARRAIPIAGVRGCPDLATLAAHPGFAGRAVWVDGVAALAWPAWRDFLPEYTTIALKRPILGRAVLCVVARGAAACAPPSPRLGLSVRRWRGIVDPLDTLLYVSQILPARPISRLERRVSISVIANVALWDAALCDILAREDFTRLLAPGEVLEEMARARGWLAGLEEAVVDPSRTTPTPTHLPTPPPPLPDNAWGRGMADLYDDEVCWHPSAFPINRRVTEVRRRVWSGQVREMLPLAEDRRRALLDILGEALTVPWEVYRRGVLVDVIQDRAALELAHIDDQVRLRRLLGEDASRAIGRLRGARNDLAHMRPLSATTVRAIARDDIVTLLDSM